MADLVGFQQQTKGLSETGSPLGDWTCFQLARLGLPQPKMVDPLSRLEPWTLLELGAEFDPDAAREGPIRYYQPSGEIAVHRPPAREWSGWSIVAGLLHTLLGDLILLDVGHGPSFISVAKEAGFTGQGAANTPVDVVVAFDHWQRVYVDNLDMQIDAVRQRLCKGGVGVFKIGTLGPGEYEQTLRRGERATVENSWMLVSGIKLLRPWCWWIERFSVHGLRSRGGLHQDFQVLRDEEMLLSRCGDWGARHMVFVERT